MYEIWKKKKRINIQWKRLNQEKVEFINSKILILRTVYETKRNYSPTLENISFNVNFFP